MTEDQQPSCRTLSGSTSINRNIDVGEIMRLRTLLGEADRLLALVLPMAQATVLRLPGYDRVIEDTRNYLHV